MKNQIYIGLTAIVGYSIFKSSQAKAVAKAEIKESAIVDGSNWQGTLWQRLSALDLVTYRAQNLAGSTNAAPGFMDQANIGLGQYARWDGSL